MSERNQRLQNSKMLYRTLGRTGEQVSAIGLGGFHLGLVQDEAESIRIVHAAIDGGITFMDNSWDYHEGKSEIRLGKALKDAKRSKVFLMTKIDAAKSQRRLLNCMSRCRDCKPITSIYCNSTNWRARHEAAMRRQVA